MVLVLANSDWACKVVDRLGQGAANVDRIGSLDSLRAKANATTLAARMNLTCLMLMLAYLCFQNKPFVI